MSKQYDDMSADEKVVYLVNGLSDLLLNTSLTARRTLAPFGFTPDNATKWPLLAMIEGQHFGQHETSGTLDWLTHLRYVLANDLGIDGLYEDEDDEESDEDETDDEESVEA